MDDMQRYLDKGIKEIINEFPEIENILNKYNIGCAPCNVGTCLLRDVVEIHNLSSGEEQELMTEIARIIFPDRHIKIPKIKKRPKSKEIKYSPPIKRLVKEHKLIKRLVALMPEIADNLDLESENDRMLVLDSVDFIRFYADKYHHAKEEDILFQYFDENLDIIKAMHKDHENARAHVKEILKAVEAKDKASVKGHLDAYCQRLTEHIKKEDEILYPWMDRNFSVKQVGELFSKFDDVAKKFADTSKKYEEFVNGLEERFKQKEAGR